MVDNLAKFMLFIKIIVCIFSKKLIHKEKCGTVKN